MFAVQGGGVEGGLHHLARTEPCASGEDLSYWPTAAKLICQLFHLLKQRKINSLYLYG